MLTIIIPIANNAEGTAAPDNIFNMLSGNFPKSNSKNDNNSPIKQEIITGFFDIDFKAIIKFENAEVFLTLLEKIAVKAKTKAMSKTKINEAGIIAFCPKSNITKGIQI